MAKGKLVQSESNVQRLLNDKDAMRKMVENAIQNIVIIQIFATETDTVSNLS